MGFEQPSADVYIQVLRNILNQLLIQLFDLLGVKRFHYGRFLLLPIRNLASIVFAAWGLLDIGSLFDVGV